MKTPRFIVTGGAGFIGSNLVAALNSHGHSDILIVDRLDHPLKETYLRDLKFGGFMDLADFRRAFLDNALDPVTTVFHLGACSSTTETNEAYLTDNNFLYTRQLCEWCLARNIRFIYASSAATYGDGTLGYSDDDSITPRLQPLNLYGRSKQQFDLWALENRVLDRAVGLKYFNVFGPREDHKGDMRSVVHKAHSQIRATGRLQLFKSHRPDYRDGEQDRDFVYVRDAVAVTLFFHDHPGVSGLFNCGTGRARTWLDLGRAIFAAMGCAPEIDFIEMPVHLRDKYQYHTQADISKLRRAGYTAPFLSIEDAVRDYVRTWLDRPAAV
mgnify:CR=1 FL=1